MAHIACHLKTLFHIAPALCLAKVVGGSVKPQRCGLQGMQLYISPVRVDLAYSDLAKPWPPTYNAKKHM